MRLLFNTAAAICIAIATVMPAQAVTRSDEPVQGARIRFEQPLVDLGEIAADAPKRTVDLTYLNDGTVPLVITETRTGCSCVAAAYKRGKVMPGEHGTVTVTLDPAKAPEGKFFRVIQIFSNSATGVARITIKAEITK